MPQGKGRLGPIRLLGVAIAAAAVVAAALIVVVVLLGASGKESDAATTPPPRPPTPRLGHVSWVIGGAQLAALRQDNAGLARRFFDNGDTFVVGTSETPDMVPKGYRAIPTASYTSLHAFVSDFRRGEINPRVAAVIYDPEAWARTPASEREDPLAAMRRFASLAKHWGYGPIIAPGRDLALSLSGCAKQSGELLDQAYLRCGLTAGAAEAEDFVIQAAPVELDPPRLHSLLRGARAQLRQVAPEARYFASLSTDPPESGEAVWPIDMVRAARLELKHVPGIMLNFTPATMEVAASFLRDLERQDPINGMVVSAGAQAALRAGKPQPSS